MITRAAFTAGGILALASVTGRGAGAEGRDPLVPPTGVLGGPNASVLALGKIESLPPGVDVAATVERCEWQAPSTENERHYSQIEYALEGEPSLALGDGYHVTLVPGDALWIPPLISHVHGAASLETARVLIFTLRPASDRGPHSAACSVAFRSETIPQPPVQRYYESLVSIAFPPDYATAPVSLDALQTFYVLSGSVDVRVEGADARHVDANSATYVAPLRRYELSTGEAPAKLLVYSVYGETPKPTPSP